MTLVSLPNLYTTPADVYDYLGSEGAQLRLDDRRLAQPQTIAVTQDAAALDTTLHCAALAYPLLKGTVLVFDGGDMDALLEVSLASVAQVGDTTLSVTALGAAVPATAQAKDSGVNTALAARLSKSCKYGTSQVKLYCSSRYDDSQLAQCWSANRWATVCAAKWLATRLCRPCPKSIAEEYDEALDEMKAVRYGQLSLEDVGTRTAGWPFVTNTTVDIRYSYARVRVEQPISEGTPTQYGQFPDWNSVFVLEY